MTPATAQKAQQLFLLAMGLGLIPVALSYGAVPDISLPWLYGLPEPDPTTRHLFRAIMGLYLGMIALWIAGAFRPGLRMTALWTVFVFVTGIAAGRALSVALDGWPQPLLLFYLLAELALAVTAIGLILLAPQGKTGASTPP